MDPKVGHVCARDMDWLTNDVLEPDFTDLFSSINLSSIMVIALWSQVRDSAADCTVDSSANMSASYCKITIRA